MPRGKGGFNNGANPSDTSDANPRRPQPQNPGASVQRAASTATQQPATLSLFSFLNAPVNAVAASNAPEKITYMTCITETRLLPGSSTVSRDTNESPAFLVLKQLLSKYELKVVPSPPLALDWTKMENTYSTNPEVLKNLRSPTNIDDDKDSMPPLPMLVSTSKRTPKSLETQMSVKRIGDFFAHTTRIQHLEKLEKVIDDYRKNTTIDNQRNIPRFSNLVFKPNTQPLPEKSNIYAAYPFGYTSTCMSEDSGKEVETTYSTDNAEIVITIDAQDFFKDRIQDFYRDNQGKNVTSNLYNIVYPSTHTGAGGSGSSTQPAHGLSGHVSDFNTDKYHDSFFYSRKSDKAKEYVRFSQGFTLENNKNALRHIQQTTAIEALAILWMFRKHKKPNEKALEKLHVMHEYLSSSPRTNTTFSSVLLFSVTLTDIWIDLFDNLYSVWADLCTYTNQQIAYMMNIAHVLASTKGMPKSIFKQIVDKETARQYDNYTSGKLVKGKSLADTNIRLLQMLQHAQSDRLVPFDTSNSA